MMSRVEFLYFKVHDATLLCDVRDTSSPPSTHFPHLQMMELDKLACDVTAREDVLGQHTPLEGTL